MHAMPLLTRYGIYAFFISQRIFFATKPGRKNHPQKESEKYTWLIAKNIRHIF